jgi:hypothetical protein
LRTECAPAFRNSHFACPRDQELTSWLFGMAVDEHMALCLIHFCAELFFR